MLLILLCVSFLFLCGYACVHGSGCTCYFRIFQSRKATECPYWFQGLVLLAVFLQEASSVSSAPLKLTLGGVGSEMKHSIAESCEECGPCSGSEVATPGEGCDLRTVRPCLSWRGGSPAQQSLTCPRHFLSPLLCLWQRNPEGLWRERGIRAAGFPDIKKNRG